MARTQTVAVCAAILCVGCFTPNENGESSDQTSTAAETGNDDSTSGTPGSDGTTATEPTPSSSTGPGPQDGSSTTSVAPFCGDGVIDADEECDDGVDNNALDAECLPDCNANVCGDGNQSPSEMCDDGDDNALVPGACAPDCSTTIETKSIVISAFDLAIESGDFGPNPAAAADAMCPSGYMALLAVPGSRQVTNTPNNADAIIDWPISPYTAYTDERGALLWVTDDVPLLAVRNRVPSSLEAPISASDTFGGPYVVTGLRQDWTANTGENCSNFTSDSFVADLALGTAPSTQFFLQGDQFFDGCDDIAARVYCVEQ